jgi:hypothetical protein
MIVCHKYKFIFLKTRKTAGTSIEIALSKYCDSNDIITLIAPRDEKIRQELGYPGPQNCDVPLRFLSKLEWLRMVRYRKRKQYYNHAKAPFIRGHIDRKIWNGYFKFCFERNPFDKAISRYYWETKEPRPSINDYLNETPSNPLSNWPIYTINDHIAVDFIGRYENLDDDLATVAEKIGLPGQLDLPRAKGAFRQNREHYSKVLDAEARARIEVICAKEIARLDYSW